jgi:NAD-reducing hydrogenase large subunit
MDDNNQVTDAKLHVVEFRGFEKFIQGHPYWKAPMLLQRICGICFVIWRQESQVFHEVGWRA